MIRTANLDKFYEAGYGRTYVLRRIDVDIKEGEFVTIMGPSGAGNPRCSASSACWTAHGPASSISWITPFTR